MQGKIEVKRNSSRRKMVEVCATGMALALDLFRLAVNKIQITMVTNVLKGHST